VARRRVWARVEGLPAGQDRPLRRARALALPALTGALVAIGVVAILRMVPATRPTHAPVVSKRAPSATASVSQLVLTLLGLCPRERLLRPCALVEVRRPVWRWSVASALSSMLILC